MTRKLFSVLLCAFALLLLMGAGIAPEDQPATLLAEEESVSDQTGSTLETDSQSIEEMGNMPPLR